MTHPHQQHATRRIIVVGAGIAGLAAAHALAKQGHHVTVLEQDTRVGGRIRTDHLGGMALDTGAAFLAHFYRRTFALIRELRLAPAIAPIPTTAAILRDGRLYRVWPNVRVALTPLISTRSKLALLRVALSILRRYPALDVRDFPRAARFDTRSVAAYSRQFFPEEVLEYVMQPPLAGIFYWTPEHTSQSLLFLALKAVLGVRGIAISTLKGGLEQLPQALATRLDVRLNTGVQHITPDLAGGYRVSAVHQGVRYDFHADGVVCATTASAVPHFIPGLNVAQHAFFRSIAYSSTAVAIFPLDAHLPSDFYSLFLPRREAPSAATALIQSGKIPALPPDRDALLVYANGQIGPRLCAASDADILATLYADICRHVPPYARVPAPASGHVVRWNAALPLFDVGHIQRLRQFAAGDIEQGALVFAGDYLGGPFIEGAILSGEAAAARLQDLLQ